MSADFGRQNILHVREPQNSINIELEMPVNSNYGLNPTHRRAFTRLRRAYQTKLAFFKVFLFFVELLVVSTPPAIDHKFSYIKNIYGKKKQICFLL